MDKKTIILIVFTVIVLAVMFNYIGIENIINALKVADPFYVSIAILVQVVTYILYSFRWQILNRLADMDVSLKELIPMVLVSLAVNNITPSARGGGEPVRAYILARQKNYPMEETFATVVADRALDTFPFIVLAAVTILAMALFYDISPWLVAVMILAVIVIVALLIVMIYMCINPNFGNRVENWILALVRRFYKKNNSDVEAKIHDIVFGFQNTMKILISNRKVLAYTIILSFIIWLSEIIRVYFVFLAFGASVNFVVIGEVFILACLVGMIPLLPGGIGSIDSVMIIFYSAAGISSSISAAATVIERMISFVMTTIIGLVILPYYGTSILTKVSFSSTKDVEKSLEEDLKNEK